MNITDYDFIHPEEPANLNYWSKKWHVSRHELVDAIITTGSLEAQVVKDYLKRDSWIYHPLLGIRTICQQTINFIF